MNNRIGIALSFCLALAAAVGCGKSGELSAQVPAQGGKALNQSVYDFTMFSKISVKGKHQHPLYAFLTDEKANPGFGGAITWNFNKFLVGRNGKVVGRFGSKVEPGSKDLVDAVEKALAAASGP